MIELKDKLYTSTEVADIIGVSLRSVYRYLEEGKLKAEVKTATGRHRFTKKNILDFLYPEREEEIEEMSEEVTVQPDSTEAVESEKKTEEVKETREEKEEKEEPKEQKEPEEKKEPEEATTSKTTEDKEEEVDWLAKFREAAKKYNEEPSGEEAKAEETTLATEEAEPKKEAPQVYYYRSKLGGLKEIAQNIDKTAKNSDLEYAFTMHAGLSLFKPIKPFSTLHAYIKPKDRSFYEKVLMLTPAEEDNAQLALITWPQEDLFKEKQELHGLSVVSNKRLLSDIAENDEELHKDALEILE